MTKALLVALRTLPKKYVRDGTMAVEYGPLPGCVVVIHNELPAICYYPKQKKRKAGWRRIRWKTLPTTITSEGFTRPANLVTAITAKS